MNAAAVLRSAMRIIGAVLVVVVGFALFQWAWLDASARTRQRMNRAELTEIFTAAASDGTLADPPRPATNFTIVSRHGGEPYMIRYTNSLGQPTGYSAHTLISGKPGTWEFKELVRESPEHSIATA